MAIAEKLYELEQREARLLDETEDLFKRCEKENRLYKPDEDARMVAVNGKNGKGTEGGELFDVRLLLNQARRQLATHRIGDDVRSGKEPGSRLSAPLPHEDPVNTRNGRHHYSLMRAAAGFLPGGSGLTGLEAEVSQELEGRSGVPRNVMGFKMPYRAHSLSFKEIDAERRALDSGAGAGTIPTILSKNWIDILRNSIRVMQAGATEILDVTGKFAIPRQNATATSYWVAESGSPTTSNQTFDQVPFTPRTIGAFTDISRRFFELTMIDSGEEFVKADLTAILARGIDLAALNGSGSSNQPLGILQNQGITSTRTVALGPNGLAPTWTPLVEMFTIVMRGNAADLGEFSYISNADVYGTLATTAKIGSTFPIYLLDVDNGTLYGKKFWQTQQVPNNLTKGSASGTLSAVVGGIWNQLVMAYWSGVDILVDPYTGSSSGTIRIVALQDMDIQVRHNEAFSVIVDMITNQSQ